MAVYDPHLLIHGRLLLLLLVVVAGLCQLLADEGGARVVVVVGPAGGRVVAVLQARRVQGLAGAVGCPGAGALAGLRQHAVQAAQLLRGGHLQVWCKQDDN